MPPTEIVTGVLSGLAGAALLTVLVILIAGALLMLTYLVLTVAACFAMAVLAALAIAAVLGAFDPQPPATAPPPPTALQAGTLQP